MASRITLPKAEKPTRQIEFNLTDTIDKMKGELHG
jgi:hypothetical protein